ncbi:MAG: insulinase family protein [Desulfobacterales bacterium]|nr:insulinase family protein [Desulfobacterales bacterium]
MKRVDKGTKGSVSFNPLTPHGDGDIVRAVMHKITVAFQRDQLANGLKILTLEDPSHPIVSYQVHFATGSRNERPGITGISHLFEHMMFRGSKELGPEEFARVIQANGGTLNAFTTIDNTSYFENLPADKLELAVRLESERLENLRLNQESLDTEREVVRSERKLRTANSPFGLLIEQLFAIAFDQHPYQWPVIGWDHDLKRLTLEDCLAYYRQGYAPNNAVVVICGAFKRKEALAAIEKYYGHLKPHAPVEAPPAQELPQRGERRAFYKKVSHVEAFFAGFHCPGIKDPDVFPLLALSHILSHGKSSRFYLRFVKTGKAIEAQVDADPPPFWSMDPGLLQVYAIAAPGVPIGDLEQEIWEAIEEIKDGRFDEAELAKARQGSIASFIMGLQSVFFKGLAGGLYEIRAQDCGTINTVLDRLEGITFVDVKRVAQRYLIEDNRTVVTLKPITPEENERLEPIE